MIKKAIILFSYLFIYSNLIAQESEKPNIILILADDLGYSDIGCYGGEIKTPALDKMANGGMRLSSMYNAGMCVISRSSLLTGKWWPKAGYGIKENNINIAQRLKKIGYRTGLVGKWHLNEEPNDNGFDYFFGFLGGYSSYFKGGKDYRFNKTPYRNFGNDFYSTDAFTNYAIDFINPEKSKSDKPFFLYLSYQAPHNPLQASKKQIMKHRGNYLKGWQAIRDARIKNQIKFGIINSKTPLPEYPENLPDWESLSPEQKDLEDLRMAVYAAMIEKMDNGIGKLLKSLEDNNQIENTLILFMSDNGTDSFSVMDEVMLKRGVLPGDNGSNYQPGTGWAYASVTPNRLYKISQHNGGVKTGAIAYWPKGIKEKGSIYKEPLHMVDIVPTILDLTSTPKKSHSTLLDDYAGKSFTSIFEGKKVKRPSPLFFQFMDNRAIRTKKWSLVEIDGSGWEIYNTKKDPLETNNLSKKLSKRKKTLDNIWLEWWKNTSNNSNYTPESTSTSIHYKPQGDQGSGNLYIPSAMPNKLKHVYEN